MPRRVPGKPVGADGSSELRTDPGIRQTGRSGKPGSKEKFREKNVPEKCKGCRAGRTREKYGTRSTGGRSRRNRRSRYTGISAVPVPLMRDRRRRTIPCRDRGSRSGMKSTEAILTSDYPFRGTIWPQFSEKRSPESGNRSFQPSGRQSGHHSRPGNGLI